MASINATERAPAIARDADAAARARAAGQGAAAYEGARELRDTLARIEALLVQIEINTRRTPTL